MPGSVVGTEETVVKQAGPCSHRGRGGAGAQARNREQHKKKDMSGRETGSAKRKAGDLLE